MQSSRPVKKRRPSKYVPPFPLNEKELKQLHKDLDQCTHYFKKVYTLTLEHYIQLDQTANMKMARLCMEDFKES